MQWQYEYQVVVCTLSAVRRVTRRTALNVHTIKMHGKTTIKKRYFVRLTVCHNSVKDECKMCTVIDGHGTKLFTQRLLVLVLYVNRNP